jgi:hypothetical protein
MQESEKQAVQAVVAELVLQVEQATADLILLSKVLQVEQDQPIVELQAPQQVVAEQVPLVQMVQHPLRVMVEMELLIHIQDHL